MTEATDKLGGLLNELLQFVANRNCQALKKPEIEALRDMDAQIGVLCAEIGRSVPEFKLKPDEHKELRFMGHCRVPYRMAQIVAVSRPIRTLNERRIGRTMIVYAYRQWATSLEQLLASLKQEQS
jgi:hypothetical protein